MEPSCSGKKGATSWTFSIKIPLKNYNAPSTSKSTPNNHTDNPGTSKTVASSETSKTVTSSETSKTVSPSKKITSPKFTPAQAKLKEEIVKLNANISDLKALPHRSPLQNNILKEETALLEEKTKKLNMRIKANKRQQKLFEKKKNVLKTAAGNGNKDAKRVCREGPGRPRYEEEEKLLQSILLVANQYFLGSHERRRNEVLNSVKTLDELSNVLKEEGFEISRSGLYLRLVPRDRKTTQGKLHVKTVSKLCI